ncbi:FecCD family ABC transporter permease [Mangrovihabitans endophyticus]|uniref:ABC transporter permease n=1 Tax=Mangrovihabitans endophyticus TaxID=1751298 RepID=A0A8J3C3Y7_9ACTN|nr:iron chelate uptake ABC transporter family permease subunit [Mangrovihabitans endophyticus]GGL15190.1 ABC transporter permease [Mangrovihabitans endophyticus]
MIVLRAPGGWSVRVSRRAAAAGAILVLATVAVGVLALGGGDYPMSAGDVLRTLGGGGSAAEDFIVWQLRLPRLVTAVAVGGALALAGALSQSLVRNPLGSPDVLGVTQGAATGALLVVVAGGGTLTLTGAAMAGGLGAALLIQVLAWRHGVHGYRLILVGIGVAAMLTGVNGYLLTRGRLMEAARAVLWLTGSLDGRGWTQAAIVGGALAVLAPIAYGCGPALRALELGDDAAASLGVGVSRVRAVLLMVSAVLAATAASVAGPVAFVALTAPHLARRLTRSTGPNLLPATAMGALLVVAADEAAQRLFGERQLPVGVVTGALGGGYLIWLLVAQRRAGRL